MTQDVYEACLVQAERGPPRTASSDVNVPTGLDDDVNIGLLLYSGCHVPSNSASMLVRQVSVLLDFQLVPQSSFQRLKIYAALQIAKRLFLILQHKMKLA